MEFVQRVMATIPSWAGILSAPQERISGKLSRGIFLSIHLDPRGARLTQVTFPTKRSSSFGNRKNPILYDKGRRVISNTPTKKKKKKKPFFLVR
jgi:hypothetical protein